MKGDLHRANHLIKIDTCLGLQLSFQVHEGGNSRQHSRGACHLRESISSRIVLLFGNVENLDNTIFDIHGSTLGPADDADALRTRVTHGNIQSLGDLSGRVSHEGDQTIGLLNALGLSPSIHHSSVVHAKHNHFIDSDTLEIARFLNVARNLHVGSRGREGAGERDQNDVLAGHAFLQVHLRWGETVVKFDGR